MPCVLLFLQARDRDLDELRKLVVTFGLHRHASSLPALLDQLRADALVDVVAPWGDEGDEVRRYRLSRWIDPQDVAADVCRGQARPSLEIRVRYR